MSRLIVLLGAFLFPIVSAAQTKDTSYINNSDFESIITYSARDSIYSDFKKKLIHLYGDANLNYEGVNMKADYLLIDLNKNEVYATHTLDSLGRRVGSPVFSDGSDTIRAASLKYNFDTKKAFIKEVAIRQDEIYLSMEVAKRQKNEDLHFVRGKFTTCNLSEPHFHFFMSRAVLVPDKRIVTGPINLWVLGIPTPLGLPFSVIPQRKEREKKNGFILPQFTAASPYGFGIQNLGYYFPISEKLQTTAYVSLYSRGSFGVRSQTEYFINYRFQGAFDVDYQALRTGFPDNSKQNVLAFKWTHRKDAKSNPNWSFSSDINFSSNSSNKQTLNLQNTQQYLNNTLNSDIRLGRKYGTKPISSTLKLSMRQNSQSGKIGLTSPEFNTTVTRFYPFKRKKSADGKVKFYETIGATYSLDAVNRSDFRSTYLSNAAFDSIGRTFQNGLKQNATLQTTINVLKNTVRITPSVTYSQKYNFQSIEKSIDTVTNGVLIDTVNTALFSQALTISIGLTTNVYSYYRFIGRRSTVLRHVATPSISFGYSPEIQGGRGTYTDTLGRIIDYSKLERSVYSEGVLKSSGTLNFSLNNTFEIKQRSNKDTITGFKKTRLIENLLLSTSYDIFKDSMNWSNLNISIVMRPTEALNINITGVNSFYAWDRNTGISNSKYAINSGQGIGRLTNFSINTGWTFASKKSLNTLQNTSTQLATNWNPEYQQWLVTPAQLISFDIPWKVTLNNVLSYSLNSDTASYASKRYLPTNTLSLNGDVSISQNWKIAATTYFDAKSGKVTNTNLTLFRNIHCWNVNFSWTPIGTNKSFTIAIRGNGSVLSAANLNLRRPPLVL